MELSPNSPNNHYSIHPTSCNTYTTANSNILHNHPNVPDALN